MFTVGVVILLFILFLTGETIFLRRFIRRQEDKRKGLLGKQGSLKKEEAPLKEKVADLENKCADIFFFYDLTRKLAPILNKEGLFNAFFEEMKHLGGIESAQLSPPPEGEDCLKFKLSKDGRETLYIKTKSEEVREYLPHFSKLLSLCLERVTLYKELQQLSIYDSLTEIYNRRYFMERFEGEFTRAKNFNFNLSFLMVDIDRFKKINDTYGHLVGDVVLREIARLICESIREIDFVARFGGEEFSIILPETDKNGAIMVAERIRARVSQEEMEAFDEILTATISAGVATFPQNALHSKVLIEAADKALYQAKISGRNRVCSI